MSVPEKDIEKVIYLTWSDYQTLSNRIRDLNKKINLLLAILVEKKVLGEKMADVVKFGEAKEVQKVVGKEIVEWYEAKAKRFIQKAKLKKGALRAQLGIKEGETIPKSLLQQIAKAEVGTKVSFRGKSITVTAQLKKRAVLAKSFGKMKKK